MLPLATDAYVRRIGDLDSTRDLTRKRRHLLSTLTTLSSVLANLQVAFAPGGCTPLKDMFKQDSANGSQGPLNLRCTSDPFRAAKGSQVGAGNASLVRWLLQLKEIT